MWRMEIESPFFKQATLIGQKLSLKTVRWSHRESYPGPESSTVVRRVTLRSATQYIPPSCTVGPTRAASLIAA